MAIKWEKNVNDFNAKKDRIATNECIIKPYSNGKNSSNFIACYFHKSTAIAILKKAGLESYGRRMRIGYDGDRLYFDYDPLKSGPIMRFPNHNGKLALFFFAKLTEESKKKYCGSYEILFDPKEGLYFIDLSKKDKPFKREVPVNGQD